jgi:hypothetical protein
VSTPVAVSAGLGAAAFFAAGTALQYRATRQITLSPTAGSAAVGQLARGSLSSPMWLLGTAILIAGFCLHAVALHQGPLSLIQPLLICGVLFTLPASKWAGGPAFTIADMRWAVALVVALACFLLTATPASSPAKDIDTGPAFITFATSAAFICLCVAGAYLWRGRATPTLLGVAAGVALAGSAALIKVCTDVLGHGVGTLLVSWQLYALLAVALTALLLCQLAYRAGPMATSLPAINTANPTISVIIGTVVFDERFRATTGAVAIEAVSLSIALVATVVLSRRAAMETEGEPAAGVRSVRPEFAGD